MSFYVVLGAKASIQSPACDYTENLLRDNSIHVYYLEYITITNSWPPNKVSFKQIPYHLQYGHPPSRHWPSKCWSCFNRLGTSRTEMVGPLVIEENNKILDGVQHLESRCNKDKGFFSLSMKFERCTRAMYWKTFVGGWIKLNPDLSGRVQHCSVGCRSNSTCYDFLC